MQDQTGYSRGVEGADESSSAIESPCPQDGEIRPSWREWNSPWDAEQDAHRMFHRTLASWAMDVLALRRRGLDVPGGRVRRPRRVPGPIAA